MSVKNKFNKRDEELIMENQLIRAKLELLSDGKFSTGSMPGDLSPKMENMVLSRVLRFEEAKQNAKEVTVHEIIGSPDFIKSGELNDDDLAAEILRIEKIMGEHQVMCDSVCGVDDRLFYQFITEELFNLKVTDIRVPGMTLCFTYEEFHPNHEYDTGRLTKEIIESFVENRLKGEIQDVIYKKVSNMSDLICFRNLLLEVLDHQSEIISFIENGNLATVRFRLSYKGLIIKGHEPLSYEGEGEMTFENHDDYWIPVYIYIPGMVR